MISEFEFGIPYVFVSKESIKFENNTNTLEGMFLEKVIHESGLFILVFENRLKDYQLKVFPSDLSDFGYIEKVISVFDSE